MNCTTHHHACECREKEFEELRSHLAECERVSDIAKKRGAQLAEAKEVLWKIKREVYRHKNACDCGVCSAHALLEKWGKK